MDAILLLAAGGVAWAVIWILVTLAQTLLYGALTCAAGVSCSYMAGLDTPAIFPIGDTYITISGIFAFLMLIAMFKFGSFFLQEASLAIPKLLNPFAPAPTSAKK